ncbi:DUF5916 domain-containing protein [Gammaproteobacteria bacterium]|nr:DUF5916 domain-containing protein [Gammaproteobacteria bacterium]
MKITLASLSLLLASSLIWSNSIVIDGSLDEPEWNNAFEITDFYETSPFTLKKNELLTTALIFSNKDGIYVGFKNFQSNDSMFSRKTLRDQINSLSDKNSINIDFDGDGNKAFILAINLGNSLFDAIKMQAGDFKTDWDGDWIAKTQKFDGYWVSEFFIPWDVTLMRQPDGDIRKINYTALRYSAENESWVSSAGTMASRNDYFQELDSLEIQNYTKSKLTFFPYISSNKNSVTNQEGSDIGAEIFYSTGKGRQINLAINPDFGQAESDDVVINFSAQETFYSEKRAFFNENQSLFDISNYDRYSVINTRRIGAAPSYNCSEESNEEVCEAAKKNYSDIDFALRLTQKSNNNEFGVFVASEADEAFSVGRDYYALRSRTKLGNKTLGFMVTNVENEMTGESSTVNVIDYINIRSKKLITYSDLLASEKDGKNGLGYRAQFTYLPNKLSNISGSLLYFEDDFELNDFGYLQRRDWIHAGIGGNRKINEFDKSSILKQIDYGIDLNYDADTAGNSNPIGIDQKNSFSFKDNSKFQLDFNFRSSGKNTTITRKNEAYPFIKSKRRIGITADFEAKNYSFWTYDWRVSFFKGEKDNRWDSNGYGRKFYKIAGSIFPNDNLRINAQYRIRKENEWLIWQDNNNLASYDSRQDTLSFDLNWFRNNKHEIRLKSQFVALKAKNPISIFSDANGYLYKGTNIVNEFNTGVASFQIRYKYELAPLSYLFLVYSKGGRIYDEEDDRSQSELFKEPWENPSDELFSIKFRLKY